APSAPSGPQDQRRHLGRRSLVHFGNSVHVEVLRDRRVRVAEPRADDLDWHPSGEGRGRIAVAYVVEADTGKFSRASPLLEPLADPFRVDGRAVRTAEHEPVVP